METEYFSCFETDLRDKSKRAVELLIQKRLGMVNNENRVEGDIWLECGTIRFVFNRVPEHFRNELKFMRNDTKVLSYK